MDGWMEEDEGMNEFNHFQCFKVILRPKHPAGSFDNFDLFTIDRKPHILYIIDCFLP